LALILSHILPTKHRQEYGPHEQAEDCPDSGAGTTVLQMLLMVKKEEKKENVLQLTESDAERIAVPDKHVGVERLPEQSTAQVIIYVPDFHVVIPGEVLLQPL